MQSKRIRNESHSEEPLNWVTAARDASERCSTRGKWCKTLATRRQKFNWIRYRRKKLLNVKLFFPLLFGKRAERHREKRHEILFSTSLSPFAFARVKSSCFAISACFFFPLSFQTFPPFFISPCTKFLFPPICLPLPTAGAMWRGVRYRNMPTFPCWSTHDAATQTRGKSGRRWWVNDGRRNIIKCIINM